MNMSAAMLASQPPGPNLKPPVMAGWTRWPSAWENAIVILHSHLDHDDDAGARLMGNVDPALWHIYHHLF